MNPDSTPPLAIRVVPPAHRSQQRLIQMETAMQALVLDARHPIALEITGTAQGRSFLVRATTPASLEHVVAQLQARYPQAGVLPLPSHEDPFTLRSGETVSAVELKSAHAAYLPLHTWDAHARGQEETDPLLGILAALDAMPQGMRTIAQLALVPAPADWSKANQRKAIEHALEPERQKARQGQHSGAPNTITLLLGTGILLVLLLYGRYKQAIPSWLREAVTQLLHGTIPVLAPSQRFLVIGGLMMVLLSLFLLFFLLDQGRRHLFKAPMYDMKQVAEKTSRMAYRVRLRLYVIGPATPLPRLPWQGNGTTSGGKTSVADFWQAWKAARHQRQRRMQLLARLLAAYRQYHSASGNAFTPCRLTCRQARCSLTPRTGRLFCRTGWGQGLTRSRHLISVDSLANLWHLPHALSLPDLAQMTYRRSRTILLPPALAEAGAQQPIIGISEHAGHQVPFGLPPECLSKHLLIGGKSGEGKSTLMEHLALRAMEQGGLIVIDPHGDLVEHLLCRVPASRRDEVVLIDLSETDDAIGINLLDATLGRSRDKAVGDLLKTLSHIWAASWGSRMEIAFEYALRTLYEANLALCAKDTHTGPGAQYTLLDVMPVLTDESFCHMLLEQVEDPFIRRWWQTYYEPLNLSMQRDRSDPVLSKVAKFESQIARRIIGQGQSTINFRDCIQQERIMLVKLAKGVVGEDVAHLLGATILGLLQLTMEEQAAQPEGARKRFPVIVDEFQVLAGVDWAAIAELRKYGVAFYLATQSFDYLRTVHAHLLPTVLANVHQLFIFHMSASDAHAIYHELGVAEDDILHMESHTCYVRLTFANGRQPTFSLKIIAPSDGDEQKAEAIRQACRKRYMVPAATVDAALQTALLRTIVVQQNRTPHDTIANLSATASTPSAHDQEAPQSAGDGTLARQHGGYRGRKSQEKREQEAGQRRSQGETTPMNWAETVGYPLGSQEDRQEQEQEGNEADH